MRQPRVRSRSLGVIGALSVGALLLAACGGGASSGTTYWQGNYSGSTAYWSVTINGNQLAGWQSSTGAGYTGTPYHLFGHENADNTWDVGDDSGNSYLLSFSNGKMYVKNENSNYPALGFQSISQEQYDQKTNTPG